MAPSLRGFTLIAAIVSVTWSSSSRGVGPPPPDTFPSDSVPLPLNARPVFFGPDAGAEVDATFVRVDADGETPLAFEERPSTTFADRAFIVDPGVLEPSSTLFIEGRCGPFCSPPGEWTVSDIVDDTPPVFTGDLVATAERELAGPATGMEEDAIRITIPSLEDDSGPVLVRLVGEQIDEVQPTPHDAGQVRVGANFSPPGSVRTVCMIVSAIDIAGNEATAPNEACADFSGGCSQGPTPSVTLLISLLACLALFASPRRRRGWRV